MIYLFTILIITLFLIPIIIVLNPNKNARNTKNSKNSEIPEMNLKLETRVVKSKSIYLHNNSLSDINSFISYVKEYGFNFEEGEEIDPDIDYTNMDINNIYRRVDKYNSQIYDSFFKIRKTKEFEKFSIDLSIEIKLDMESDNPKLNREGGYWQRLTIEEAKEIIDDYYKEILRDYNISKILDNKKGKNKKVK